MGKLRRRLSRRQVGVQDDARRIFIHRHPLRHEAAHRRLLIRALEERGFRAAAMNAVIAAYEKTLALKG